MICIYHAPIIKEYLRGELNTSRKIQEQLQDDDQFGKAKNKGKS
jgi:hypothetical protein